MQRSLAEQLFRRGRDFRLGDETHDEAEQSTKHPDSVFLRFP
jgi:hypothetical protein